MKLLKKGEVINETYEIKLFIGEGAFGQVYSVNHKFFGIQVLKVFKNEYVENTDINTVVNEAKILSKLSHENIVRVFEVNSFSKNNKEHFFITMGFVHGETLSDLLKRKISLDLNTSIKFFEDTLKGLSKAHSHKIIHRDINTDNILISYEKDDPKALLSDFGLSQDLGKLGNISGVAGRYIYFAPECFSGVYLPTSDVFSLGMVFYKMLTGVLPWEIVPSIDEDEMVNNIFSSRKKNVVNPSFFNNDISIGLDKIILKSISLDIENRFKNSSEFLESLNQIKS